MSQDYLVLIYGLQAQLVVLQRAIASQQETAPKIVQEWQRLHSEIQIYFRSKIINTDLEVTPENLSLQVEIDKQLKMLGVDLAMLQASRSSTTWQKRYQQASDRLVLLSRYCQMYG